MDTELMEIMRLFSDSHPILTIQQIGLLLDRSEFDVCGPVSYLHKSGYLRVYDGYVSDDGTIAVDTRLTMTYEGKHAIKEFQRNTKSHFWVEFRAWATLLIALAAFIKSFFF